MSKCWSKGDFWQMTAGEILASFTSSSVTRGGEIFLPPGVALQALNALETADFAVVGIEGVRVTQDATEPDLDLIAACADESQLDWDTYRRTANECARRFLTQLPARADLFVSFGTQSAVQRRGY